MKHALLLCGCLVSCSLLSQGFNQLPVGGLTLSQFAIGDFNSDGQDDFLGYTFSFFGSSNVLLFLSLEDGPPYFEQSLLGFDVEIQGRPVAADFDGDGDIDVAITLNTNDAQVAFLINDGNGSFMLDDSRDLPGGGLLETADFDNDGAPDLVALNNDASTLSHFENNGVNWEIDVLISNDDNLEHLQLADIDNDGDVDILPGYVDGLNRISLLENNGIGTFSFQNMITTGPNIASMKVGDFNDDGLSDIYASYFFDDDVRVYLNEGDLFFNLISLGVPPGPTSSILPADFDGDGLEDFAVGNNNEGVVWFKNLGTEPASTQRFEVGDVSGVFTLVPIDLENDGDIDMLASDGELLLYENILPQNPSNARNHDLSTPKFYPNPVNDQLYFQSLPAGDYRLTITDIYGRMVLKSELVNGVINMEKLDSGSYLVNLFTTNGKVVYAPVRVTKF